MAKIDLLRLSFRVLLIRLLIFRDNYSIISKESSAAPSWISPSSFGTSRWLFNSYSEPLALRQNFALSR